MPSCHNRIILQHAEGQLSIVAAKDGVIIHVVSHSAAHRIRSSIQLSIYPYVCGLCGMLAAQTVCT